VQFRLFPEGTALSPGAPCWATLPEPTRRALTALMTRLLIAHAGGAAGEPGGGGC
jgi:hypothetical protein